MPMRSIARTLAGAAGALALLGTTVGASAEEPKEPAPNTGRISLNAGVDFPTRYYFRGILQEDDGWIVQPYGDVTFKLYESTGPLSALNFTLGVWNSFHGGSTGADGAATVDPKAWYEADFFASLSTTLFEDFTAAVIYTAYMSPNDSFGTIQEVAVSLGYNDARWLGAFALNPTVLMAFEVKNQADNGSHLGGVIQIGVAPGLTVFKDTSYPIALSFPVAVSLSLYDYYEFNTGNNNTFGAFTAGVKASLPLKFIPPAFGNWQVRASGTYYHFGQNTAAVNNGNHNSAVGLIGLSMSY
jgi:hypothetical protein